jgi:lipoyl(octanoyl) transferase
MAINIRNDLSIFDLMVPCGIENVEMTSVLKETGREVSMSTARKDMAGLVVRRFSAGER